MGIAGRSGPLWHPDQSLVLVGEKANSAQSRSACGANVPSSWLGTSHIDAVVALFSTKSSPSRVL